jgi:D-alanyl-D-alanine dipeptidase
MKCLRYMLVVTVALAIIGVAIALLVRAMRNPGDGPETPDNKLTVTETPAEPTSTPTQGVKEPTPELSPTQGWRGDKAPIIGELTAKDGVIYVSYSKIEDSSGYEVCYRIGEGDWQVTPTLNQTCSIPVQDGADYTVRVRALGPYGEGGKYSKESTVHVDPIVPVLALGSVTRATAKLTLAGASEGTQYMLRYKAADAEEWFEIGTTETELVLGALTEGREYVAELMIPRGTGDPAVSEAVHFTPKGEGYGDLFRNACGLLNVNGETRAVSYTMPEGCLGVNGWAEFNTELYSDAQLKSKIGDIKGGTAVVISADENGEYVYNLSGNRYGVHVSIVSGGDEKQGWVLGNAFMVDLAMIFPCENPYSIQYNRTNAYSSIFTCGGNAQEIDGESEADTRYDPLRSANGETALTTGGYNIIGDVTGQRLPNYGPETQMPAVWDVAVQLLTAQRNALDKGCCLLIYESYRPNATSKAVYRAMKDYGYFREEIGPEGGKKLTLANGFLAKNYTEANYIASDSNHNKGIALDLTICSYDTVEELGSELMMQTKMHTLDYRGNMDYNTEAADLLYDIMTEGTGLIPLRGRQEWWHFELNKNTEDFPCVSKYVFADYGI